MKTSSALLKVAFITFISILFLGSNAFAQKDILIDFGSSKYPSPANDSSIETEEWNNLSSGNLGDGIPDLKDNMGRLTGIGLTITDSFWQQIPGTYNGTGTRISSLYPASATRDSLFIGNYKGFPDTTAKIHLSGLEANKTYHVRLYASRMTDDLTMSDRITVYSINGISKELQAINNVDGIVEFKNLIPVNGTLDLTMSIKPGSIYGYLGIMEIIENTAPVTNAGADKTITLPTNSVMLTGSSADTGGSIAKYSWTKVAGGTASISSPVSANTSVTGLAEPQAFLLPFRQTLQLQVLQLDLILSV